MIGTAEVAGLFECHNVEGLCHYGYDRFVAPWVGVQIGKFFVCRYEREGLFALTDAGMQAMLASSRRHRADHGDNDMRILEALRRMRR